MDKYDQPSGYADRLEAELRNLGSAKGAARATVRSRHCFAPHSVLRGFLERWQDQRPPESAFESRRPFYGDTMAFTQWLQFVLLARIRQVVAEKGGFPAHSQVGSYAVREFDTDYEAQSLTPILKFDKFIEVLQAT